MYGIIFLDFGEPRVGKRIYQEGEREKAMIY
jgi:hypothetical protein